MSSSSSSSGIGVFGLLGVAFIVLRLTDYISWSWWWVLAPFWMPIGVVMVVAIPLGIAVIVVAAKS